MRCPVSGCWPSCCFLLYYPCYCTALQQRRQPNFAMWYKRAPPIFGRAAITLGIGPRSSLFIISGQPNLSKLPPVLVWLPILKLLYQELVHFFMWPTLCKCRLLKWLLQSFNYLFPFPSSWCSSFCFILHTFFYTFSSFLIKGGRILVQHLS